VVPAYALPAAAVWALLGACLGALPLARPALAAAALYALCYGTVEATGSLRLRAPGSRWQVPQTMVAGASRRQRIFVWGSVLGPGFLTRNPYAGFGLLPLVAAAPGGALSAAALGAAIGVAHATGRALALLRDARPQAHTDPMRLVLTSMYWRRADGFALLVIAGAAVAACAAQFT
jgi:hypothetical protein